MRLFELQTPEKGTYVAALFSDQTISNLQRFQKEIDVANPISPDDFHCTIISSRIKLDLPVETDLNIDAKPCGLNLWDTRSGEKCLVLEIESDYLCDRFDQAISMGATHDFKDYTPHVTLSYNAGDIDVSAIEVPDFFVRIIGEYKEDVRENQ